MLEGSCHCGAVRLTLPFPPEVATDCNCSLCRRIGGPTVYYEFGTVKIEGHPQCTSEYIWGTRHSVQFAARRAAASHIGSH